MCVCFDLELFLSKRYADFCFEKKNKKWLYANQVVLTIDIIREINK